MYIHARSTLISESFSGETMLSKEAWALGYKGSCAPALVRANDWPWPSAWPLLGQACGSKTRSWGLQTEKQMADGSIEHATAKPIPLAMEGPSVQRNR